MNRLVRALTIALILSFPCVHADDEERDRLREALARASSKEEALAILERMRQQTFDAPAAETRVPEKPAHAPGSDPDHDDVSHIHFLMVGLFPVPISLLDHDSHDHPMGDFQVSFPDSIEEDRRILRGTSALTLEEMTGEELEAFQRLHRAFVDESVLEHHHHWHRNNGPGGTWGAVDPTSGEIFLGMHRSMMHDLEEFIGGGFRIPRMDTTRPIPAEFPDPSATNPRRNPDPDVGTPAWLTVDGIGIPPRTADGLDWPDALHMGGETYRSLEDIETLEDLGRAIGAGYHGSVHNRIGGVMGTFGSPTDPIFYAWHSQIDGIVDDWLTTDSGRAWTGANPTHPILDRSTPMHVFADSATLAEFRQTRP